MAQDDADPGLSRRRDVLASIPGIGTVTAMAISIEMPELGALDNKQAASLAGLAPMTRQSGTWSGRARITGGRRSLRNALYMPALVALRFRAFPVFVETRVSPVSRERRRRGRVLAIQHKLETL